MRVPWTAKRSNQSILKEISPDYSLEGLMLKLKLQYCGHLMQRTDSLEKTLMLGKIKGGRRRGRQRMRWLDGITDSMEPLTHEQADVFKKRLSFLILCLLCRDQIIFLRSTHSSGTEHTLPLRLFSIGIFSDHHCTKCFIISIDF